MVKHENAHFETSLCKAPPFCLNGETRCDNGGIIVAETVL